MSCEICGSTKHLIHHHESYEPEVIMIVCRSCHRALHLHDKTLPTRPTYKGPSKKGMSVVIDNSNAIVPVRSRGKGSFYFTIPKLLRDLLKINEGDTVRIKIAKESE